MPIVTLVGDTHGKIKQYKDILSRHPEPVIQVGDMGCGFMHIPNFAENHKFIRGNHDSPSHARSHPNYLGDYGYLPEYGIFYLAGAFSIDWEWRQKFMDSGERPIWWPDEELDATELNKAYQMYCKIKPRIVVSHECPQIAGLTLLQIEQKRLYKTACCDSRTAQTMQAMFDVHKPDLWVFGHYHFTRNFTIDKTRFLCLNELESFTLDTNNPTESFYGNEIQTII